MKVTLTKPVMAHNEELSELTFRDLETEDVMELGYPMLILVVDDGVAAKMQPKVIGQYISRLAKIPLSSVKKLCPRDFDSCAQVVQGFFNQGGSGL